MLILQNVSIRQIIIFICLSLIASLFSLFAENSEILTYNVPGNMDIRGFPLHFIQHNEISFLKDFTFKPLRFLFVVLFWFLLIWSLHELFIKNSFSKYVKFLSILTLGGLLTYINIISSSYCTAGFPISFWPTCLDSLQIPISSMVFYTSVNFIFWSAIALILVNIFYHIIDFNIKKWRFFVDPLLLLFLSIFHYESCGGFLCFFPGNGIPLGYLNGGKLSFFALFFDYMFILIFYFILVFIFRFLRKKLV